MSVQQVAIIVTDELTHHELVRGMREALAKLGFARVVVTNNLVEISNIIHSKRWPVFFVDHDEEDTDGVQRFESIFRIPGNQLFTYFLMVPYGHKPFIRCHRSLGFAGLIRKPVQSFEVAELVRQHMIASGEKKLLTAQSFTLSMMTKNFERARQDLEELRRDPRFKQKAAIAEIYLKSAAGAGGDIISMFPALLKNETFVLRALSDYAYFLKKLSLNEDAAAVLAKIREVQPLLTSKIWEEFILLMELEKIDSAARIIEHFGQHGIYDTQANAALARMMTFVGLSRYVPFLLASSDSERAAFDKFMETEAEKRKKLPAQTIKSA